MKLGQAIIPVLVIGAAVNGGFYLFQNQYLGYTYDDAPIVNAQRPQVTSIPKSLTLVAGAPAPQKFSIPQTTLAKWVRPFFRSYTRQRELAMDAESFRKYLDSISDRVDVAPKEGRLAIDLSGNLTMAVLPESGYKLNIERTINSLTKKIGDGDNIIALEVDSVSPEITAEKISTLGIKGLLGAGESDFAGSPLARTNNIITGAAKYNGMLIKPSEEFSFNEILGPVDDDTEFEYELVVKNGKLIKEPGGGICQVSTTFFRAAMNSGFKITERHYHSLPVRYYNPQGLDATIYPGSADFKFLNDTGNFVLIQTKVEGTKLIVEFYGSPDGREVAIIGPTQYDVKPDGSLRAVVTQSVKLPDGTTRSDKFYSNYKSPSLFTTVTDPAEVAPRSN